MDFIYYIMAGGLVGLTIGLTGVGGGSLMTPLLILLGFPYNVAIGTDLLYAAITKSSAMLGHARKKTVEWHAVRWLAAGSIPASLITLLLLQQTYQDATEYHVILTRSLGVMLVLTSLVLLFNRPAPAIDLARRGGRRAQPFNQQADPIRKRCVFRGICNPIIGRRGSVMRGYIDVDLSTPAGFADTWHRHLARRTTDDGRRYWPPATAR